MTIHNLMNAMINVSSSVAITVIGHRTLDLYYYGKYEDCSKNIYEKTIEEFSIDKVEKLSFVHWKITNMTIYVEE